MGLLLALVFILVLPTVASLVSFVQVSLTRETYSEVLRDAAMYDDVLSGLLPALIDGELGEQRVAETDVTISDIFGNLDVDDWQRINDLLIPPDWLHDQIDHNINATFDWLESDAPVSDWSIEMTPVRMRLLGTQGREVANILILSWDECTPEEEAQLKRHLEGKAALVLCQPPGAMLAEVSAAVTEPAMNAIAASLSGDFSFLEYIHSLPSTEQEQELRELQNTKYNINIPKLLGGLWYLLPLAILALIVIVVVRNARTFFNWMGWSLLLGGLATLLVPVVILLPGAGMLGQEISRSFHRMENRQAGMFLSDAAKGLLGSLINAYTRPILLQAAAIIVIGFIALLLATVFKPRGAVPQPGRSGGADWSVLNQTMESVSQVKLRSRTDTKTEQSPHPEGDTTQTPAQIRAELWSQIQTKFWTEVRSRVRPHLQVDGEPMPSDASSGPTDAGDDDSKVGLS